MKTQLSTNIILALLLLVSFFPQIKANAPVFGGTNVSGQMISGAGTTNSSTTINTTSTAMPSYTNFLGIYPPRSSTSSIACFVDGQTAPSSSVVLGSGFTLGLSSTSVVYGGESGMCFGIGDGCAPFVTRVNCRANIPTPVGTVAN